MPACPDGRFPPLLLLLYGGWAARRLLGMPLCRRLSRRQGASPFLVAWARGKKRGQVEMRTLRYTTITRYPRAVGKQATRVPARDTDGRKGAPLHVDTIPPAQSPEDKRGSKESLCRTTVPGPKGANDIRDRPSPCLAREGISRKDVLPGVSGQRTTSPVANLCHRRSTPALAREHTCDTKAPGKRGVLPNLFRPRCGMCRIFAISARPFPPQGDGRQT